MFMLYTGKYRVASVLFVLDQLTDWMDCCRSAELLNLLFLLPFFLFLHPPPDHGQVHGEVEVVDISPWSAWVGGR